MLGNCNLCGQVLNAQGRCYCGATPYKDRKRQALADVNIAWDVLLDVLAPLPQAQREQILRAVSTWEAAVETYDVECTVCQ